MTSSRTTSDASNFARLSGAVRGKIVITGHRGFIGAALLEALLQRWPENVIPLQADLRDGQAVRAEVAPFCNHDLTLLHLATINRRNCRSHEDYTANGAMLINLLHATRQCARRRMLFASSTDVFGVGPKVPLSDDDRHAPADWYGLSKSTGEWILRHEGIEHAVFRLPGVFGARPNEKSLVRHLMDKGRTDGVVALTAEGNVRRDFVLLDDLIALALEWIHSAKAGAWNVASGRSQSLLEIVTALRDLSGAKFRIHRDATRTERDFDLVFETNRLKTAFPGIVIRPFAETCRLYTAALGRKQEELPV